MKKTIIVAAIFLSCAIGVAALDGTLPVLDMVESVWQDDSIDLAGDTALIKSAISDKDNTLKISEKLSVNENTALNTLAKKRIKGKDIQNEVYAYADFLAEFNPTVQEEEYINSLIVKGYNAQALTEIFKFWRDTTEDIEIIEEVYKLCPDDLSILYWVDSAFITLDKAGKTKNHYSDLSVEEVRAYYEKGISYEEMFAADEMSRRGTKDIETILNAKCEGLTWFDIADGVYGISSENTKEENSKRFKDIKDPYEIIDSIAFSKATGEKVEILLDEVAKGESSTLKKDELKMQKLNEIKSAFEKQGLPTEPK